MLMSWRSERLNGGERERLKAQMVEEMHSAWRSGAGRLGCVGYQVCIHLLGLSGELMEVSN